jgi:hypothetical protein
VAHRKNLLFDGCLIREIELSVAIGNIPTKEVVFFYKSGMLDYIWSFDYLAPKATSAVNKFS